MQAIILAGGFGTRLQSVIKDIPKVMAPINGKPFLQYVFDYLQSQGITEVILSVHHLYQHIQDYFKNNYQDISISYAIEKNPLGTGGAIVNAIKFATQESVFVLNGDTFVKLNYLKMLRQHQDAKAFLSLAITKLQDTTRFGCVKLTEQQKLIFQNEGAGPGFVNAGVYILNTKFFREKKFPKHFSFEKNYLYTLSRDKISPEIFITDEYFIDIGVPEDYLKACNDFSKGISHAKMDSHAETTL